MDLLSITRAIWRHKIAVLPVLLITALGVFYVVAVKPPVYQASSQVLLAPPQAPPTAAQIAKDPKLGKINTNNPYADLGNLQEVADVVISIVTTDTAEQALLAAGANPDYQVALSPAVGSPPIIEITGVGSTPQQAILSANLVASACENDLTQIQRAQDVSSLYMIKSIEYVTPQKAKLTVSAKLRTLIAVLGLGAVLLLVVVSLADAMEKRRMVRSGESDYLAQDEFDDADLDELDELDELDDLEDLDDEATRLTARRPIPRPSWWQRDGESAGAHRTGT
jgi:capsular polysaccharide biosynthesis protein